MSDNTPTQRFDSPVPPESEIVKDEKKNRGLMIALIVIGAVILIAIIILLFVLLRGNGKPTAVVTSTPSSTSTSTATASASPSATPIASAIATPTKSSGSSGGGSGGSTSGPKINSFTAKPAVVACPAADAPVKGPTDVQFRWSTSNVDSVEFGLIDSSGNYQVQSTNLPPQGTSSSDIPGSDSGGWAYPCGTDKVTYVLKATGSGKTVTAKVLVDDATYN